MEKTIMERRMKNKKERKKLVYEEKFLIADEPMMVKTLTYKLEDFMEMAMEYPEHPLTKLLYKYFKKMPHSIIRVRTNRCNNWDIESVVNPISIEVKYL